MTAVQIALKQAVATGKTPEFYMGWQRNDRGRRKPQTVPELVQDGIDRFTEKCGAAPDTVVCCPENVERLTHFPHIIVRTMSQVWHPDLFYFGRSDLARCGR